MNQISYIPGLVFYKKKNIYWGFTKNLKYGVKYTVGEIITNFIAFDLKSLREYLGKMPFKNYRCKEKNIKKALDYLNGKLLSNKSDPFIGRLIYATIYNSCTEYLLDPQKYEHDFLSNYEMIEEEEDGIEVKSDITSLFDFKIQFDTVGGLLNTIIFSKIEMEKFLCFELLLLYLSGDKSSFLSTTEQIPPTRILFDISFNDLGEPLLMYSIIDILSMALFEIANIKEHQPIIKICPNCNKFFVVKQRSDTKYCDRTAPQDASKSCKEYGSIKTYQDKLKHDEAMGLYRKIYMSKQMLARRHEDIQEYRTSFEEFKVQTKKWKQDIKNNVKTEFEYIEWLKGLKEKRY